MMDDLERLDNMMAVGGRLDIRGSGPAAWRRSNKFAEGGSLEDINLYGKGGKKNSSNRAITISPNVYKAMKFFMDRGMPRVGAAGLVGGFMRESSGNLSPNALNPSSKALGIAQWLGSRKRELIRRYGSNPTFEQQLEFVWHELNTNYKRALRELMAARTPTQAADAALGWYEFSEENSDGFFNSVLGLAMSNNNKVKQAESGRRRMQ